MPTDGLRTDAGPVEQIQPEMTPKKEQVRGHKADAGPVPEMTAQEEKERDHEIQEATPIEFYDLFFVANLTTVTGVHYITEKHSLASYGLFFIILWFTWLHVTLLDVRYSVDSVYERVCKSTHFIVMAGFSSVSTTWNPLSPTDQHTIQALRTMTLALMFSRFVLMIQYFVVMIFARIKKKAMMPLALHALVMGIAGSIYLGLYFAFTEANPAKSYIGWYITAIFEATCVFGISSIWRLRQSQPPGRPDPWEIVSFKYTHLVERMKLLTLIVLGEGIIVMLKAINAIVMGVDWTKGLAGIVIAALSIIYLLWMFYFDYIPENNNYIFIRQKIWTLLHFPFHLSIVLAMEGLRQLSTLYGLNTYLERLNRTLPNETQTTELMKWFAEHFDALYKDGTSKTIVKDYSKITDQIANLATVQNDSTVYGQTVYELQSELLVGTMEYFGMKAAKPKKSKDDDYSKADSEEKLLNIIKVFDLVYEYYFISFGIIFLIFGIFTLLVRRKKNILDYLSVAIRGAVAVVMFGMVGLYTIGSGDAYYAYLHSRWPISQVCIMLVVALMLDKALDYVSDLYEAEPCRIGEYFQYKA